jgi:hypothetical protein
VTKSGYPSSAVSTSSSVLLYFGNGKGAFSKPKTIAMPGPKSIALGDVNGDGNPDIINISGYVVYGLGDGKLSAPVTYSINTGSGLGQYNVVAAPLTNSGLADIITDAQPGISVLLSQGKGSVGDGIWTGLLLGTGKPGAPFTVGSFLAVAGAGCLTTR